MFLSDGAKPVRHSWDRGNSTETNVLVLDDVRWDSRWQGRFRSKERVKYKQFDLLDNMAISLPNFSKKTILPESPGSFRRRSAFGARSLHLRTSANRPAPFRAQPYPSLSCHISGISGVASEYLARRRRAGNNTGGIWLLPWGFGAFFGAGREGYARWDKGFALSKQRASKRDSTPSSLIGSDYDQASEQEGGHRQIDNEHSVFRFVR